MRTIGQITKSDLDIIARSIRESGATPNQAGDQILLEARARYPDAVSVQIIKATAHDGFDIVAL